MQYLYLLLGLASSSFALPARNDTYLHSNTSTIAHHNGDIAKPSPVSLDGPADHVSLVTVTVTATPSGHSDKGFEAPFASPGSCNGDTPAPNRPHSSPIAHLDTKPNSADKPDSKNYWSEETASSTHTGPVETLAPVVHWNIDTSKLSNVVPVQVGTGCPQYFAQGGVADPSISHFFGTITYFFTGPSVHLDYSDFITGITYSNAKTLIITFGSQKAYNYAMSTWKVGLILISHSAECGGPSGKGCYFVVGALNFQVGSLSVICSGSASDVQGVITHGDTEWGVYEPKGNTKPGKGSEEKPSPSSPGAFSTTLNPSPTAYISVGSGVKSSSSSSSGASPTGCIPPTDTKYRLPTACKGNKFDLDLDTDLGISDKSDTSFDAFLAELSPGTEQDSDLVPTDTALEKKSVIEKRIFGWIYRKIIKPAAKFIAKAVEQGVQVVKKVGAAIADAVTISKDFSVNLNMQIPKSSGLKDLSTKIVASPWGNSILLKSFGYAGKADKTTSKSAYLNIFCVDCGAKGSAQISGKAAFSLLAGITEGWVQAIVDLDVVLKLGVDAQLVFTKEFNNNLFEVSLVGLEFGIVKIGPMISLGTHVTFEAKAKGRLLAGAEFGLKKATARIDFVNPSRSSKSNWTPYFQPIFQADGEIMLSAELGLPIGIKCGVTVATFSKSVSLYDEPSIRAIAEFAAATKLDANNNVIAGVLAKNGCAGISTQVQWRNKLYVDILGLKTYNIFDTLYNTLAQGCIVLPLPTIMLATETTASIDPVSNPEAISIEASATIDTPTPEVTPADPVVTPTAEPVAEPVNTALTATETSTSENPQPPTEPPAEPQQPETKRSASISALDFPKLNYRRDTNTTASTNATINDLTSFVVSSINTIDYKEVDIRPQPYNRTDGYEYTLLVDSSGTFLVTSCSNGNVYVQNINATTQDECSDLWASRDDVTGMDGNSRLMHYYSNTMAATGVSRLRVSTKELLPKGAIPMGLVPVDTNPDVTAASDQIDHDKVYFGADIYENLFSTAVCTYADNQAPKVFLLDANLDIDAGLAILKSSDVEYSITGGLVSDCFLLTLVQGLDEPGAWESDDATENITDSFDLDWTMETGSD